ncbi:FAD binding domain-containing protein [Aspergillus foveolatus]|uniref:FAD binding domain-containing protein n=1 Tax=Aspergillus foveolatus TaxID=210207 RepID=UPI003CCCF764
MAFKTSQVDLLIIGAGPAGLMAACWASRYRMSTRIIDAKEHRTETGHADGVHSRTLEILDSFGIVDPIMRRGVHEVEMSYWGVNKETSRLECQQRARSQPEGLSRFGQMLLNQGEVEQILIDYIESKGRIKIQRQRRADKIYFTDHESHPVTVESTSQGTDRMTQVLNPTADKTDATGNAQVTELIQARYVVGCDGARSLVREQLNVPMEAESTDSMWGVIDIVPITDFPDIRQSCAIHSDQYGSVMTAPREDRLVRFYIQLKGEGDLDRKAMEKTEESSDALIQMAQRIMQPYSLTYKYCDWSSIYPIKQGLVEQYHVNNRVFLAGDAAHTHSPKAGQGMNVSIQDTYNLLWKLGSVITGVLSPKILETYELERHPVAEELMKMDCKLVQTYEQSNAPISEVCEVRRQFSGFMSGVEVTYGPNVLIASKELGEKSQRASNVTIGRRLGTVPLVNQADASTIELARALPSTGAWRLLVFPGDLRRKENVEKLVTFSEAFQSHAQCGNSRKVLETVIQRMAIELILIHKSPRTSVRLLDLPELFHPFDDKLGWDYGKVFVDEGSAYAEYGIDEQIGCAVLCRPDQHVAWVGGLDEVSGLDAYFSALPT